MVLLQFAPRWRISQVRAAKVCGLLLYGLAALVLLIAILGLLRHAEADTNPLGIAITAGALLLMPILARMKRREVSRGASCVCTARRLAGTNSRKRWRKVEPVSSVKANQDGIEAVSPWRVAADVCYTLRRQDDEPFGGHRKRADGQRHLSLQRRRMHHPQAGQAVGLDASP